GRNLLLNRALIGECEARGVALMLHHHDWWFENRWQRWPEMRASGFRTLTAVARAILPTDSTVRHLAINQMDTAVLKRHFDGQAEWMPNLAEPGTAPSSEEIDRARRWLRWRLDDEGPVWLIPCRLLRRKNVAEAVLLARWLRPEAWLVTTGGTSSTEERPYAEALRKAGETHRWRLRLGVLQGGESGQPSVAALLGVSEVVLLTSLQEGFGLPYLEASLSHRPLLARRLPNIAPDLARFGFRFPQAYDEILVDPALFDWTSELGRQRGRWVAWKAAQPRAVRPMTGLPALLALNTPGPVPFSRLTLRAQIEVLRQPPEVSWRCCAPLNPFLERWRRHAAAGQLRSSPWPRTAGRWLSGQAYAARFVEALRTPAASAIGPESGLACQTEFLRAKLADPWLYPLLWTSLP
ncbi:MAG: glycosyltransferase family protein, partial [Limisphaerales bacterium]